MAWKQWAVEVLFVLGAVAPLYNLVLQLIRLERNAALDRREIQTDLRHMANRIDDLENWRSTNSGLRLPP